MGGNVSPSTGEGKPSLGEINCEKRAPGFAEDGKVGTSRKQSVHDFLPERDCFFGLAPVRLADFFGKMTSQPLENLSVEPV